MQMIRHDDKCQCGGVEFQAAQSDDKLARTSKVKKYRSSVTGGGTT
jgi:hypothetical protein